MSVPYHKRKESTVEFIKVSRDLHIWSIKKSSNLHQRYAKHFDKTVAFPLSEMDALINLANNTNLNKYYAERTQYFDKALALLNTIAQQYSVLVEAFPEQFSKSERSDIGKTFYKLKQLLQAVKSSDKKRISKA